MDLLDRDKLENKVYGTPTSNLNSRGAKYYSKDFRHRINEKEDRERQASIMTCETHRWHLSPLMPLVVQKHLPLLGLHMLAWPLHLQAEKINK